MRTRVVTAAGLLALVAGWAVADVIPPQTCVTADFADWVFPPDDPFPPDICRRSAGTLPESEGYTFNFRSLVLTGYEWIPLLGWVERWQDDMPEFVDSFNPGLRRVLKGAVRAPGSDHLPMTLCYEPLDLPAHPTPYELNVDMTIEMTILADRKVEVCFSDLYLSRDTLKVWMEGPVRACTWTPPAPVKSEWNFDRRLLSVKESEFSTDSGPAKIRYLDDCRLEPSWCGVTERQSSFGWTSDFGISSLGDEDDIVYKTSPAYDYMMIPPAPSRAIGLALWPNAPASWPDHRHGQWTMVWDLYVPWESQGPIALVQDHHNNADGADAVISRPFSGEYLYFTYRGATFPLGVQADEWFRLAVSCDGYRTRTSQVFVNGEYVGTTGGHWIDASANPSSTVPVHYYYSDELAVEAADWTAWGQFPSPWALSPGRPESRPAPMASTACLFADNNGDSESVYIANFGYTDEAMSDAQIATLGEPNARGIWSHKPKCAADLNGDGLVDFADYLEFLNYYERQSPRVDFNYDGEVDFGDYLEFLTLFEAECRDV